MEITQVAEKLQERCLLAHKFFPNEIDKEYVDSFLKRTQEVMKSSDLSDREKRAALKRGAKYYLPRVQVYGDRALLLYPSAIMQMSNDYEE
jgi:hypothetical protein